MDSNDVLAAAHSRVGPRSSWRRDDPRVPRGQSFDAIRRRSAGASGGGFREWAAVSLPSPRSGDRVLAVVDDRDAETVEGILHIRHIPARQHVHVDVIVNGRSRSVRPDSIKVVRTGEVPVRELEDSDPVVGDDGWLRIVDIDQARDKGLLPPQTERTGGTWEDLFAALHERVLPLLDAGWVLTGTEREESWEFGDSVFYDLQRGTTVLNIEYYEHGQLVAYPVEERPDDWDGEAEEPYFSIADPTPASTRSAYEEQGWLRPAGRE